MLYVKIYDVFKFKILLQPGSGLLSLEATEVLDRVREGADRLRNNTNSFLSGELLSLVPVRINVSGELEENSLRIKSVQRHHSGITDGMKIIIIIYNILFMCAISFFFLIYVS